MCKNARQDRPNRFQSNEDCPTATFGAVFHNERGVKSNHYAACHLDEVYPRHIANSSLDLKANVRQPVQGKSDAEIKFH